jgi:mannan endo-1,4-beta-mannosidase
MTRTIAAALTTLLFAVTAIASPGFQVQGRDLYDRNGERVLLRGINKMNVWTDHDGSASFPEIRKTGANTVRIVWAIDPGDWNPTAADLDVVIGNAVAQQLIPMIELHDATGDWAGLRALVDYWVRPDVVAVLRKYEQVLLVNVGNEVGDDTVTTDMFVGAYRNAVQRMRDAGIRAPLVIDAPDWGKNLDVLTAAAPALLGSDPDHNLLFSVHLYWPKLFGADADFIRTNLQLAADAGYPLIVGEFSRYGAYAGGASMCSDAGETDYRTILAECDRLGIGWYAWEWGPGNTGGGDPLCDVMDMTVDGTAATLKAGWATEVVVTSPYGIAATSVVPSSMREPFGPSEPPAIDGGGEPSGSEPCTSGIAGAVCTIDRTLAAGVCTSDGRVSQRVDTARRALAQALEQGGSRRIMRFAARRLRQAARVAGRRGDTACAATLDALRGAL